MRTSGNSHLTWGAGLFGTITAASQEAFAALPAIAVPPENYVRNLFILALLAGVLIFALMAVFLSRRKVREERKRANIAFEKLNEAQNELSAANAILNAEPLILIRWNSQNRPRLLAHSLFAVVGVPEDHKHVLSFASWIEVEQAGRLQKRLLTLIERGTSFDMTLQTRAGGLLEAYGLTAGGRALLKFRDLAGERRQKAELEAEKAKLDEQVEAMHTLLDAFPSPVWLRDRVYRLKWVNEAYLREVNAPSRETVYEQQIELLERRQCDMVRAVIERQESFHDKMHTVVGGDRRMFDLIALPLGKNSGGIAIDVGAEETAQNVLERHIKSFDLTLDRVSTAVAIFGDDHRLNYYNQAYKDLWSLDAEWLDSHPALGDVLDRLHFARRLPEEVDYREWKTRQLDFFNIGGTQERTWHLPGSRTLSVMAHKGPDGSVTYLYEDETERLDLESRYQALTDVQRETLDALREGVAVFAQNGRLHLFNPAFVKIWRLNIRDLEKAPHINEIIEKFNILYEDAGFWRSVKSTVTAIDETRQSTSERLLRPDGSVLEFTGVPLPDGASMLTFADITDVELAERALIERNEALEAADKLKNAFISHVSYELRTPLTNIIGFSEMLASEVVGPLNEKQRDYLGDISASSETLRSIINDILDLATIDAGTLELQVGPVDIEEITASAALGVRDWMKRSQIELKVVVEPDVETFIADGRRVTQVIFNLLSNAIGFSSPGDKITLKAEKDDDMIAFSIEDMGCGIPEEYQKTVFDRFESRPQGSQHRGAGLGLSIVKSLMKLHGGDVDLQSKEGVGTRVTVRFPIAGRTPRATESISRIMAAREDEMDAALEEAMVTPLKSAS